MKTKSRVVGAFVFWLAATQSVATAGLVLSQFNTDSEGWQSNTPEDVSWTATGRDDGYLLFTDAGGDDSFLLAPTDFLGDWAGRGAESISFDHKVFATGSVAANLGYRMEIAGPGGAARWQDAGPQAQVTDWVTVVAPLTETSWNVTEGTWSQILGDVREFKVGIEVFSNWGTSGEICGIDNVALIPEPCTFLLFGLGIIPVLKSRRSPAQ